MFVLLVLVILFSFFAAFLEKLMFKTNSKKYLADAPVNSGMNTCLKIPKD